MNNSSIEWTGRTWNPVAGCSMVSPGCARCYAERMAARLAKNPKTPYYAPTIQNGRWSGEISLVEHKLDEPLRITKPSTIFVNSMSDLFHERVPDEYIHRVFDVMAEAKQHSFQVLTKRSERLAKIADGLP